MMYELEMAMLYGDLEDLMKIAEITSEELNTEE